MTQSEKPASEWVNEVLTRVIQDPQSTLRQRVEELCGAEPYDLRKKVLALSRGTVNEILSGKYPKSGQEESLVDRLMFFWLILLRIEKAIKKLPHDEIPQFNVFGYLKSNCHQTVPNQGIQDSLLREICNQLMIGENAEFLQKYHATLRMKPNRKLGLQLKGRDGKPVIENIRRVSFWLLRNRSEMYVDISGGLADRPRKYIVELQQFILEDFKSLYDVKTIEELPIAEIIEEVVRQWLTRSYLDGENEPQDIKLAHEIAKQYIKCNNLKNKEKVRDAAVKGVNERTRMLELEVARYTEENKMLVEEIAKLRQVVDSLEVSHIPIERHALEIGHAGTEAVREMLRQLDSKYSLDMLNDVQLGGQTSLTLVNFVRFAFYVFRKFGLTQYPSEAEFDLAYEESGLFDCIGLDIMPNQPARVDVVRPGWALKSADRLFPIRKAQVKRVP